VLQAIDLDLHWCSKGLTCAPGAGALLALPAIPVMTGQGFTALTFCHGATPGEPNAGLSAGEVGYTGALDYWFRRAQKAGRWSWYLRTGVLPGRGWGGFAGWPITRDGPLTGRSESTDTGLSNAAGIDETESCNKNSNKIIGRVLSHIF
jgi:hypothetical protein